MTSIISALIIILLIFLFTIFAAWIDKFGAKHKEEFIGKTVEKAIDRALGEISSDVDSKLKRVLERYKSGPWYLMVYTVANGHPIWISNNNIRSVHPDPEKSRLTVKLFNGEDMVIDDVENYYLQAGNEILNYDFE